MKKTDARDPETALGGENVSKGSSITSDEEKKLKEETEKSKKSNAKRTLCKNWFKGMWRTKQVEESGDQDLQFQTILRELIIYIMFLIIVMILAFGMISSSMYWYTKIIRDLFVSSPFIVGETEKDFKDSSQIADFWAFAEQVMINNLYWDFWYHDEDEVRKVSKEDQNILYENKLIGVPRLRQVKVRNNSCIVHEDFRRTFRTCYDFYSRKAEDKSKFGPGNSHAWKYSSEKKLGGYTHWGMLTSYNGGGYFVDLSLDKNKTMKVVSYLKENLWVTRGTRAIFFDFTVYNANINLFCIVKLLFEIPPTGGIIPSFSIRTVKLLRYVNPYDYFVLGCEFVFLAFIAFYTIEEIWEIWERKLHYFKLPWNYLDFIILVMAYVLVAFAIYRFFVVRPMIVDRLNDKGYANFEFIGFWQMQLNNTSAVLVFLIWVKLFKYVSFNKTMSQLSMTLTRCAKDIGGFAIMFFIIFFAFAQLGYLLFGTQVEDFRTFGISIFTLLRTILGDFDYSAIEEANRILGPLFFLSYIFFVFFVLLNMFLAIINDTYSDVKSEITTEHSVVMMDYIKHYFQNLCYKLGCRKKFKKPDKGPDDNKLTYKDIRAALKNLKHVSEWLRLHACHKRKRSFIKSLGGTRDMKALRANFTDLEIEMFFAKYDIDENSPVREDDTKRMLTDMEGRRVSETPSGPPAEPEEYQALLNRVNHMEDAIAGAVEKVELVLDKLEAAQKSRGK